MTTRDHCPYVSLRWHPLFLPFLLRLSLHFLKHFFAFATLLCRFRRKKDISKSQDKGSFSSRSTGEWMNEWMNEWCSGAVPNLYGIVDSLLQRLCGRLKKNWEISESSQYLGPYGAEKKANRPPTRIYKKEFFNDRAPSIIFATDCRFEWKSFFHSLPHPISLFVSLLQFFFLSQTIFNSWKNSRRFKRFD